MKFEKKDLEQLNWTAFVRSANCEDSDHIRESSFQVGHVLLNLKMCALSYRNFNFCRSFEIKRFLL
jgi:hypothetical protein